MMNLRDQLGEELLASRGAYLRLFKIAENLHNSKEMRQEACYLIMSKGMSERNLE